MISDSLSLYQKFLIFLSFCLLTSGVFLSGCSNINEHEGFILKSWSTRGYDTSRINLTFEVDTQWSFGRIDLYDPSGGLINSKDFSNETHQVTFLLYQGKSQRPEVGTYHLDATEIIGGKNHSVVKKDFVLNDANLLIITCIPSWVFDTTLGSYVFKSVNLTVENHGDFFGFVYEGRIIVDNGSIFLTPDYHWHNLNLWIEPGGNLSLDLPVEVPVRPMENHYVKIFLQDTELVTVASYESPLYPSVQ